MVSADFDAPDTLAKAFEGCYGVFLVTNWWCVTAAVTLSLACPGIRCAFLCHHVTSRQPPTTWQVRTHGTAATTMRQGALRQQARVEAGRVTPSEALARQRVEEKKGLLLRTNHRDWQRNVPTFPATWEQRRYGRGRRRQEGGGEAPRVVRATGPLQPFNDTFPLLQLASCRERRLLRQRTPPAGWL